MPHDHDGKILEAGDLVLILSGAKAVSGWGLSPFFYDRVATVGVSPLYGSGNVRVDMPSRGKPGYVYKRYVDPKHVRLLGADDLLRLAGLEV